MGQKIDNHNSKLMKQPQTPPPSTGSMQLPEEQEEGLPCTWRMQPGVVYQASASTNDGRGESYVGLARQFKKRFPKHKTTLNDRHTDGQTTLSGYVWEQMDEGKDPSVS